MVSTLVMCSVSDQRVALREILRVLRPGGSFLFIEHVAAAEHSRLWWGQKISKPFWRARRRRLQSRPRNGARPSSRRASASVEIERFSAPLTIASPHIAGKSDQVMRKAVFLDLNGTLVLPVKVKSPSEYQPIAGSVEAVRLLNQAGFICPVITVQSGISKGSLQREQRFADGSQHFKRKWAAQEAHLSGRVSVSAQRQRRLRVS